MSSTLRADRRQYSKRKWTSLRDADILEASENALAELAGKFKWTKKPERLVQYYLYGYFQAKRIPMKVEHPARKKFVDFRYHGDNRALLELEKIIDTRSNYEGLAYNNRTELLKLMQHTRGQAQRRILLILDFRNREPVDPEKLTQAYKNRWQKIIDELGRNRVRNFEAVTLLYAHHKGFQFRTNLMRNGKASFTILQNIES